MKKAFQWLGGIFAALVAVFIFAQAFTKDVTITGAAPTTNVDGSAIVGDLTIAIYYGANGATPTLIESIEDVSPGDDFELVHEGRTLGVHTYYATAVNADGIESAPSNTGSRSFLATRPPTIQVN